VNRTVAVTGGTGFVGAALIDALAARGDEVKALARKPEMIGKDGPIAIVPGALEDREALATLAADADLFIHCAGLTHARRDADFMAVNVEGARRAALAAASAGAKFVHISSMAARQPAVSAYAASKRASEDAVAAGSGRNPFLCLRAPALYGPGDEATLPYFKMIKAGFAVEPAAEPPPRASILYVGDVVEAILAAADGAAVGDTYEIGDEQPEGHSWAEIGAALGAALGVEPRRIRAPDWVLSPYAIIASGVSRMAGRAPMVTAGKIREFFHPDWVARDTLLSAATAWRPRTPLKEGFAKTARWYHDNGLL
jgi:nucleoside-diphosphate-sugar epimerase